MDASILHVDMDAFFASCELAERPELRGHPVIVGGQERGVVLAATYEARAFGVRAGQPMAQARRLCPAARVIRPRHRRYAEVSRGVMDILRSVTPLVEQISIDEAFLDVSGARRRLGEPAAIAELIRDCVREQHHITCSVGIAASKSVAKIASTRAKPDGVCLVPAGCEQEFLAPLPVSVLWGVGAKTREELARWGITTVGQLAEVERDTLARAVGRASGDHLHELAFGRDSRPVVVGHREKSISAETTFSRDLTKPADMRRAMLALSQRCTERLRSQGFAGKTIGIKVRTFDFATLQRSRTLEVATDASREVFEVACELLAGVDRGGKSVRLLGIKVDQLAPADSVPRQGTLDAPRVDPRAADVAMDKVRERFGPDVLHIATLLASGSTSPAPIPDIS